MRRNKAKGVLLIFYLGRVHGSGGGAGGPLGSGGGVREGGGRPIGEWWRGEGGRQEVDLA